MKDYSKTPNEKDMPDAREAHERENLPRVINFGEIEKSPTMKLFHMGR